MSGYRGETYALLALSFTPTDRRFLDEGGSLFCVVIAFKSNDCGVSFANYLRHKEIEIDLRIGKRLCDDMSQPPLVIPLDEKSRNGGRLESPCFRGGGQLPARYGIKFNRGLRLIVRITITHHDLEVCAPARKGLQGARQGSRLVLNFFPPQHDALYCDWHVGVPPDKMIFPVAEFEKHLSGL